MIPGVNDVRDIANATYPEPRHVTPRCVLNSRTRANRCEADIQTAASSSEATEILGASGKDGDGKAVVNSSESSGAGHGVDLA